MNLRDKPGGYWKVAHRGASALAPENSIAALEAACATSVDMVELDVVVADGELRVAHSLPQLTADSPRLDEALAAFAARARPEVVLDLDVKDPGHEGVLLDSMVICDLARIDPYEVADSWPDIPILGYTNHTDTAGLRAAHEAGLDQVVARSALAERAPQLVDELVA